jgi:two-component system chemotaxis sensor kinase CheA
MRLADEVNPGDDEPFEFVPFEFTMEPIEASGNDDASVAHDTETSPVETVYSIEFAPKGELYGTGNEPLALFRALQRLGTLDVVCDTADVPILVDFDPAEPRLHWTLTLVSGASRDEIEAVFEFVADVAVLEISIPDRSEKATVTADRSRDPEDAAAIPDQNQPDTPSVESHRDDPGEPRPRGPSHQPDRRTRDHGGYAVSSRRKRRVGLRQ